MKKIVAGLVMTLVCSTVLSQTVNADETDVFETDITAEVVGGTGEGAPEEDISTKPPHNGPFVIKAASDFSFPTVPLGETRAATIAANKAYGIEVVDVTGVGSGWNVQVAMKSFEIAEGQNKGEVLKGWKLTIPTAEVTSKSASIRPENSPVGVKAELTGNLSAVVFKAEAGKGMGRYTNIFERYSDNQEPTRTTGVQLSIPNTARKAKYAGKLEWTLLNAPVK